MRNVPLGAVIKAALVAGLAAGLAVAAFHLVATEPIIDRAVELEAQSRQAEGAHDEALVSRAAQRGGLVLGFLLYGLTWSLLLGAIYHLAQRWLPASDALRRGLLLALIGYWSVGLFPFLKYPANPPGVGDAETIAYRQALYLGMLALSVGGTTLALSLGRVDLGGWLLVPAFLSVFGVAIYILMPSNPDATRLPDDIVATFRARSLVGLTLFWAVLGLTFGLLLRQEEVGGVLRRMRVARS
jgi:predicted cobalt transporter CbtA